MGVQALRRRIPKQHAGALITSVNGKVVSLHWTDFFEIQKPNWPLKPQPCASLKWCPTLDQCFKEERKNCLEKNGLSSKTTFFWVLHRQVFSVGHVKHFRRNTGRETALQGSQENGRQTVRSVLNKQTEKPKKLASFWIWTTARRKFRIHASVFKWGFEIKMAQAQDSNPKPGPKFCKLFVPQVLRLNYANVSTFFSTLSCRIPTKW